MIRNQLNKISEAKKSLKDAIIKSGLSTTRCSNLNSRKNSPIYRTTLNSPHKTEKKRIKSHLEYRKELKNKTNKQQDLLISIEAESSKTRKSRAKDQKSKKASLDLNSSRNSDKSKLI